MILNLLILITSINAPLWPIATIDGKLGVGCTEVTQSQWVEIMGYNPSKFKGDDLPVENVNYDDVMKFFDKLNLKYPNLRFRLPTNDEWTMACNGGKKTRYFFGDDPSQLGIVAWYRSNTTTPKEVKPGDWQSVGGSTKPVGQKMANQFGLYDISGNVWEITSKNTMRGGCWWSTDLDCSTSYISQWDGSRSEYVGFRLVVEERKK